MMNYYWIESYLLLVCVMHLYIRVVLPFTMTSRDYCLPLTDISIALHNGRILMALQWICKPENGSFDENLDVCVISKKISMFQVWKFLEMIMLFSLLLSFLIDVMLRKVDLSVNPFLILISVNDILIHFQI